MYTHTHTHTHTHTYTTGKLGEKSTMHQRFVEYSARAFALMSEYQQKMLTGNVSIPKFVTYL